MKKFLSVLLSVTLILGVCFGLTAAAADEPEDDASESADYTIVSPYEDVVWSGDGAWGAYRGNLHAHTTWSDADLDLQTMINEYYSYGYDFLALTDHATTGVPWNKEPKHVSPYWYQYLLGNKRNVLSDEDFAAITSGTYNDRGYGMTCVTGGNELNHLTLSKNHVNGFFKTSDVGNDFAGYLIGSGRFSPENFVGENEVGISNCLKYVDDHDGICFINHPGDMLDSNAHPDVVTDPETVSYFGNLLVKYDSCIGMEVLNEVNTVTRYDRVFWDSMLMYCLPYGKNVIGFSNTDAHNKLNCDSSFEVFMMEENTEEKVKETMETGSFFCVSRCLPGNDVYEIGPKEDIDVRGTDIPYPMFNSVTVEGHKVTVTAENATEIQWIANGKVIMKSEIGSEPVVLDLDTIEGSEDFLYIRAEILGEGGITLTQALIIDNGTAPLEFNESEHEISLIKRIELLIRATKFYEIIVEIYREFR